MRGLIINSFFFFFYNRSKCVLKFSLLCLPFACLGWWHSKNSRKVFYELLSTSKSTSIVDFFALDMCWTLYFAQKLLISMLLEPLKVAPNAKSCSKVAEHNRDRPCHTSILFCVTFYQWHSVGQLFWMDQKTHSKARMNWKGVHNCVICINTWRVCQTRAYHSQIFHWKQFATRSFSLFGGDGRLQKFADNQILCWRIPCSQMSFYKVFLKHCLICKKMRTREPELIKPFNF